MPLKIALAQINVTVGDLKGNGEKIAVFLGQAKKAHADIVVFPELAVTGYPPEDLLFKPAFVQGNLSLIRQLARFSKGLTSIVGFADRDAKGSLYNAAAVLTRGRLVARYRKMKLPNYGVFDEKRYFLPGDRPLVLDVVPPGRSGPGGQGSLRAGVSICEDIWVDDSPCRVQAAAGARVLINISASPYHAGKRHLREQMLVRRARACRSWILYVNLVGGQDELIFDGGSMVVAPTGRIVFRAPQFEEGLFLVEVPTLPAPPGGGKDTVTAVQIPWRPSRGRVSRRPSAAPLAPDAEIFHALVLGIRDYVRKNGFSHVVLGLSGGIDSALTAAIAVAALGPEAVTGVSMPSRYTSTSTRSDAEAMAKALRIGFLEIPIERMFMATLETLRPVFIGRPPDVTEENLQARIRGILLMALSNKFNWLVLATGNKSELSTGYCTLYGDMVGGFALIKDLPKTWVYRISRTANRHFGRKVIPETIFTRPPTAELKPNQRDQDVLPPYGLLDRIITAYVEQDLSAAQIRRKVRTPKKEVDRVLRMIDANEYKRRQAPLGIKITPRAFGKDRRMPITNRYRDVG